MIAVPFIYFSLLLIYIVKKKKRFELSALITAAYVITSFFAIIIDYKQLYGEAGCVKASIEIIPTLLYCFLITITILPFIILPPLKKNNVIIIKNNKLLNQFVYFYIGIFILFSFFFGSEIISRLRNPDIAALKIAVSNGEDQLSFSHYTGFIRIIARISYLFASSAMFLQVLYFYSIAFLRKKFIFNLSILVSSLMPIMLGMLGMDRSKMIYWIMSYVALAIFFRPVLDVKKRKKVNAVFYMLIAVFGMYMSFVTIARYGKQDIGSTNSLIVYAGQSFNNFCLFYEKLNIQHLSFEYVTPLLYAIFGGSNASISQQTYTFDTAVFATFAGMMIKEIGVFGSILYCLIYSIVVYFILSKMGKVYSLTKLIIIIALFYIPYLGIFGIFYGDWFKELTVWIMIVVFNNLGRRLYLNKKNINKTNGNI